jgi:hypothetical protein
MRGSSGDVMKQLFRSPQIGLLVLGLSSQAASQSLQGVVIDAASRAPIAGAVVELRLPGSRNPVRATADTAGLFFIYLDRHGLYNLRATRLGYLQHAGDTLRIRESEAVSVEIRLDRSVLPLQPVRVTARISGLPEGFETRRATGFGRFLTRQDIDNRRASQTSELLRGMPGVVIARQRRGSGQALLMRSALGLCQPAVWIDGMYVAPFAGLNIDDIVVPAVLEAAEVYSSIATVPTQYRTGTCGVVLFWTKRGAGDDRAKTRWWKIALGASAAIGLMFLIK